MPSFSSDDMRKEWVYDIKQDFHSVDGTPAAYAPGAPLHWGNERREIVPKDEVLSECVSVNSDATLFAVGVENDVYIYTTDKLELRLILRGHASKVSDIAFQPNSPRKLVSCTADQYKDSVLLEPNIIFWDLDDSQHPQDVESKVAVRTLAGRAVRTIIAGLEDSGSAWKLNEEEKDTLLHDVQKTITTLNAKYASRDLPHIVGRLARHFQSETFSHDGASMFYLPGQRPRSNSDAPWDICVWDTAANKLRLTLQGHRDAIMWTGFSPDNKLIASVSWDKTNRIWDGASGELLHTFTTTGQNWTGAFSPDALYFASTGGAGDVFVWDLANGAEIASYRYGHWCRTLDWSPDGKHLAMGGTGLGRIVIFDVHTQEVRQERILSVDKSPAEHRKLMPRFLEVQTLRYLPGGRKISYHTTGDGGVEVYDFVDNRKWRFAPKQGQATTFGWGFVFLPRQGAIVSVNGDALRVWDLPPSEGDEWSPPAAMEGGDALVESLKDWVVIH